MTAPIRPQRGTLPVLQYCTPNQLEVDAVYQRELDGRSRVLINRIAQGWDWNLFQPLVVARRPDGRLFVVDGQHRLAAARTRGDVQQLPCVIFSSTAAADEADVFVKLNQERRPLTPFALWNAALATGDGAAAALAEILRDTGWSFAGSAETRALHPGQLNIVGRVRRFHDRYGDRATRSVLDVLARTFRGQVLQRPGAMFVAIGAIVVEHAATVSTHLLVDILSRPQDEWHAEFHQRAAADGTAIDAAAVATIADAYREAVQELAEEDEPDTATPDSREPASPRAREPASPRAREEDRSGCGPLVNGGSCGRLVAR